MRILVVLLLVGCGATDDNERHFEQSMEMHIQQDKVLLTSVWDVLHAPDKLELLTLSHHTDKGEYGRDVTATTFHNYPILGRAEITSERERHLLVDGFYQSSREGHGEMLCFMPHHAIHATRGTSTVDLVICFHCLLYELYDDRGVEWPETELSRFAQLTFMQVAGDHDLVQEFDEEYEGQQTWGEEKSLRKMLEERSATTE